MACFPTALIRGMYLGIHECEISQHLLITCPKSHLTATWLKNLYFHFNLQEFTNSMLQNPHGLQCIAILQ